MLSATALLSVAVVSTSAPAAAAAPATGYHLDAASTPGAIVGDPPPAQVGLAYRYQLSFTGRAPAIVEAGSSQGLPAGLTMDRTGLISGIPTMQPAGSSSVHLGAFDLDTRQLVERRLTFDLKDDMVPGAAATGSLDMPVGDREVTRDIFATKHGESLEITDSKFPAGFTIERVDAVRIRLTGTPTADQAGTYSLTVTARNTSLAIPVHTTQTFAVTITTGGGAPTPPSDPWTNDPEFKEVKVVKKEALGLSGARSPPRAPRTFPTLRASRTSTPTTSATAPSGTSPRAASTREGCDPGTGRHCRLDVRQRPGHSRAQRDVQPPRQGRLADRRSGQLLQLERHHPEPHHHHAVHQRQVRTWNPALQRRRSDITPLIHERGCNRIGRRRHPSLELEFLATVVH